MVATDGCKLREKERKSELLTTICVCLSSIPAKISTLCSTKQDQVWQSNYRLGRFYLEDHSILLHICFVWWCIMGCKFCAIQWDFAYIHVLFYFQYRCVNSSLAFPYKIFVCENLSRLPSNTQILKMLTEGQPFYYYCCYGNMIPNFEYIPPHIYDVTSQRGIQ